MPNGSRNVDDKEIIQKVLGGEVDAFELLVTRYKEDVMKIAIKHLPYDQTEETAHVVFVKAYQSLPSFEHKSSFKTWLSSIAVRTCYDYWRGQYRSREISMSSLTEKHQDWLEGVLAEQANQSLQEKGEREEAREVLDWALNQLSPEDRMVLNLVYLEELSGKEAAKLLGWSTANVKIRTYRSRRKLYRLLSEVSAGLKE